MEKGICIVCGKEFTKVSKIQKYCGEQCRNIAKSKSRSIRRASQRKALYISNNFASVEEAKINQMMDKYKCHRIDCVNYTGGNTYFTNNCSALLEVDQNYTKDCPFFKSKLFTK